MLRKLFNPFTGLVALILAAFVFSIAAPFAFAQSNRETILYASKTYDPASAATGTTTSTTVTVETASFGDFCTASLGISVGNMTLSCAVTAANTVTVYLANVTAGTIDLGSSLLRVRVISHPPALR
jgi:hypothetical protein